MGTHGRGTIGRGELPRPAKMKRTAYEEELLQLQVELVKMQYWVKETGQRIAIVFEGRDSAGKGGTIKRFREHLNPRGAPHVALAAPNETERGQWYFQRYTAHLPTRGEIVFFDRSWYNRAGVERVMGFCTADELGIFFRQVPEFEGALIEDGIRLFKLFLVINRDEQRRRFEARKDDPLKTWKMSSVDEVALEKWDDYTEAMFAMFTMTDTAIAPWTVVNTNDKRTGRIHAIRHVLTSIPYEGKDADVVRQPAPAIVAPAREVFPRDVAPTV